MKMYLVQHGAAAAKDVDPERPLTAAGRDDVQRVATAMKRAGVSVEKVIHSGKLRAQQTAEILADELAPGIDPGTSDRIDPLDDPAGFDWQGACGGADTMLVGHLPFMAKLVALLAAGDAERAPVAYQPGSVVCLEANADNGWQIAWMLRPEML